MKQLITIFLEILLSIVILSSWRCSSSNRNVVVLNVASANVLTKQGVTYVDQKVFSGVVYELFPNSTDTLELRSFENGKPHGTWKQFYPHHQLREIRYFKNGRKEGDYRAWWENGQLRLVYSFLKDEYEGNGKEWSPAGILLKDMNFQAGHEAGMQRLWSNDGILWANYEARNGRKYGKTGVKACASLWENEKPVAH